MKSLGIRRLLNYAEGNYEAIPCHTSWNHRELGCLVYNEFIYVDAV